MVAVTASVGGTGASAVRPAPFVFVFDRAAATAGERAAVTATRLRHPVRLYLVPRAAVAKIRSRYDARAHFVGALLPNRRGRGVLAFTVPPLASGGYALAAWCPRCARAHRGRTFFIHSRTLLRVRMPPTTETCPVTVANGRAGGRSAQWYHGNGALWTMIGNGIERSRADIGGFFNKRIWYARGVLGALLTRADRLDAPAAPRHFVTVRGVSGWAGLANSQSWASREFLPPGCWKLTGRVEDVSLSFVLQVVVDD